MKKILLLLSIALGLVFSAQAQHFITFGAEIRDQNGNPYLFGGDTGVCHVTVRENTGYDRRETFLMTDYTVYDTFWLPPARHNDSIYFQLMINGSGLYDPQSFRIDTVLVPGGHIDLGTLNTELRPVCNAAFQYRIQERGRVSFTGLSNGYGLNYTWYFGDGGTSDEQSPEHIYEENGNYTAVLFIENEYGCYDSVVQHIQISNIYPCKADFEYNIDSGYGRVLFTSTSDTSGATTYRWSFGDGTGHMSYSGGMPYMKTYVQAGSYQVMLVISSVYCTDTVVKQVEVMIGCDRIAFEAAVTDDFTVEPVAQDTTRDLFWDFGDGSTSTEKKPVHVYNGEGSYQIRLFTVHNGEPCDENYYSQYVYFTACGRPQGSAIYGQVLFDGEQKLDYDSMQVLLIAYDSVEQTLTAMDSTVLTDDIDSGYFHFNICDESRTYLVKAWCFAGTKYYGDFLPTYSHDAVLWSHAEAIIPNGAGKWVFIDMVKGNNSGGPGFIGGYVSQGANKSGGALEGIQVLLLTASDDPVSYAYTVSGGRYEFANLALGTYKVRVEIPGKASAEHVVELNDDNVSSDNRDFEVNREEVSVMSSIRILSASPLKLYPNPVKDVLRIDLGLMDHATGNLVITDISGKEKAGIRLADPADRLIQVAVDGFSNGIYFIYGEIGGKPFYGKFTVNR
jgi:PKD repeat protein